MLNHGLCFYTLPPCSTPADAHIVQSTFTHAQTTDYIAQAPSAPHMAAPPWSSTRRHLRGASHMATPPQRTTPSTGALQMAAFPFSTFFVSFNVPNAVHRGMHEARISCLERCSGEGILSPKVALLKVTEPFVPYGAPPKGRQHAKGREHRMRAPASPPHVRKPSRFRWHRHVPTGCRPESQPSFRWRQLRCRFGTYGRPGGSGPTERGSGRRRRLDHLQRSAPLGPRKSTVRLQKELAELLRYYCARPTF